MSDLTKEQLTAGEEYYMARIEHDQPDPDKRLLIELGKIAYELNQLEESPC